LVNIIYFLYILYYIEMEKENKIENKIENNHLSYQQQYYIKNKEKIKNYQRSYYQNKKGSTKNYVLEIKRGSFILDLS